MANRARQQRTPGEQELLEQREWFGVTLASIADAVITTDEAGRVTFLNPPAESLTGWKHEDSVGQHVEAVFHIIDERSRRTAENPVKRVLREGAVSGLTNHTILIAKDGTERPIDHSAAPVRDHQGQTAGVVLVFRDISEWKRAEREREALSGVLAESERQRRQYEALVGSTPDLVYMFDLNYRFIYANEALLKMWGRAPEESIGRSLLEIGYEPWHAEMHEREIDQVVATKQPIRGEVPFVHHTLGRRVYDYIFVPVLDDKGEVEAIAGTTRDVTDRKQAEDALRGSEQRFRALINASSDVMYRMSPDWSEMLQLEGRGFVVDTVAPIRHWLDKYIYPEDQPRVWEAIQEAMRTKGVFELEHRIRRVDGSVGWTLSRAIPLLAEDGEIVEWFGMVSDVTERKRAEEALREADRRKDEFLAMLSHELRNPLAPIASAVDLLNAETDKSPLQREATQTIQRQAGQLTRLVNDLLEVSRITTGRIQLRPEHLRLSSIVEAAIETVRPVTAQKRHELSVSVPAEPVWLFGDRERLTQVLVNLLSNATKYTQDEGRIWLSAERLGEEIVLRIADDGVGIPPNVLPNIFELFVQGEQGLARSEGGLGIGLTLARHLLEMHGGSIRAHSAGSGRGSEFVVRLPILSEGKKTKGSSPDAAEPAEVERLRVLVVEDNLDMARLLGRLLETLGHEVRTAYEGSEALEVAREFRPEVVLLDIGLPGMDGYAVAEQLRQEEGLEGAVLVALTGYGMEADRARSQEAAFDYHLLKPAEMNVLRKVLAAAAEAKTRS